MKREELKQVSAVYVVCTYVLLHSLTYNHPQDKKDIHFDKFGIIDVTAAAFCKPVYDQINQTSEKLYILLEPTYSLTNEELVV